jgi:hypothetical protein
MLTRAVRGDILLHLTEDLMGTHRSSFLERIMRAVTRAAIPVDASQCDGPCVVHAPVDASKAQREGESERQEPIRWLSLR